MSDYTFETLNDKEFEVLTVDLLSKEFNTHVERFKSGRDGGVDGRFFEGSVANDVVIIQCKHWLKSGITALIAECKKHEASKVKKLNPSRYIFVTSLPLSAQNKKDISDAFIPYIKNESDIIGNEDINSLLAKHPDVERQHYKLWLAGTNVLQSILSNDVLGRSDFQLEEIQEFLPKYVRTENHKKAFEKLEELGSIIINGEPGIGKTTLAEQMCFDYASQRYQLVVVHESIMEAEKLYNPELQQIFYFDDFLGSNFLSAIDAKQDSHIVSFMKRVSKDSSKRFILTTRSNILNQGKRLSEKFEQGNLDRNEYEIKIQSLTEFDRAQILYNHIYFSDLPEDFIQQIYIDKRYRSIISHKNFNPRLIEFITDAIKVEKEASPEVYWDYIQKSLDNPKDIWRGMIETQISDLDRHIVIAIVLNGSPVSEEQIVALLINLKESGLDPTSEYPTIGNIMRGLVGSVLNRNINKDGQVTYSLFNPSIADFVISEHLNRVDYLAKLMSCLRTTNVLINVGILVKPDEIQLDFDALLVRLFHLELDSELTPNLYSMQLAELIEKLECNISEMAKKLIGSHANNLFEEFGLSSVKVLMMALKHNFISPSDPYIREIVVKALENIELSFLGAITALIQNSSYEDELTKLFKKEVVYSICREVTDWAIDSNQFDNIYCESELDASEVESYIEQVLSDLNYGFDFDDAEFDEVIDALDLDAVVTYNREAAEDSVRRADSYSEYADLSSSDFGIHPIDDLFDRE
ncbi:restriction endonuclease [Psychrobacter sp. NPDC078501]|uniref:nSTAND3 domain-containing NTPase n=1 Tax=Psychrobacter sp. NPDC078501 TaxID=3364495 RepID=UPI00384EF6E4